MFASQEKKNKDFYRKNILYKKLKKWYLNLKKKKNLTQIYCFGSETILSQPGCQANIWTLDLEL